MAVSTRGIRLPVQRAGRATRGLLREVVSVLGLVLLAGAPRLVNPLAMDPFIDEVSWLHRTGLIDPRQPATLWTSILLDGRPPLHSWLIFLTIGLADNELVAARFATALASIATVVGLYTLGRLLISPLTGVLAGVLWAISPHSVFFARSASSDDTLLACLAVLVALGGAWLVRHPGFWSGVLCGLALGLAVLAKTTGVLMFATPVFAIVTLAPPQSFPRLVKPLLWTGLTAGLVLAPLVPWLPRLQEKAAAHADLSVSSAAGAGQALSLAQTVFRADLLVENTQRASEWLLQYFGWPMLVFATIGLLLIPLRRDRALLYFALIAGFGLLVILDRATTLFSRYLLAPSFPIYLLAAAGIAYLAQTARDLAGRGRRAMWLGTSVAGAGLLLAALPMFPFTVRLVTAPEAAPLPPDDRFRYVEQWFAAYGLGEVVRFLDGQAAEGRIRLLVPPKSAEARVLLPHRALQFYLGSDPRFRIREVEALWRADNLCGLRRWIQTNQPTFLVVNGTHTHANGTPEDVPAYTRKLESTLARDVPEARVVLYIPRPSAPNWLSVYRIDRPEPPLDVRCRPPRS